MGVIRGKWVFDSCIQQSVIFHTTVVEKFTQFLALLQFINNVLVKLQLQATTINASQNVGKTHNLDLGQVEKF